MRRGIAIERDGVRRPSFMPDRLLEEGLGCGHIACAAQPEVDGLPGFIHGSVGVDPLAAYLDIGLIDSPRATTGSSHPAKTMGYNLLTPDLINLFNDVPSRPRENSHPKGNGAA
jgi:hypothetical protein